MAANVDEEELKQWVGNTEQASTLIDQRSVSQMQSIIGRTPAPVMGEALPHLWHWMYTFPLVPLGELNTDGHPKAGGFLPPVALPSRMWAGARLEFVAPLKVGETMHRMSTIDKISHKEGRSGPLCFVTIQHQFSNASGICILEEHDIVYRADPVKGAKVVRPPRPAHSATWSKSITPSSTILFRYSAATFNTHRIHYDREFCYTENYPGLVFHGPLTATLLVDQLESRYPKRELQSFHFKALSPLFDTAAFTLNGCTIQNEDGEYLWAENPQGELAIQAKALFRK